MVEVFTDRRLEGKVRSVRANGRERVWNEHMNMLSSFRPSRYSFGEGSFGETSAFVF